MTEKKLMTQEIIRKAAEKDMFFFAQLLPKPAIDLVQRPDGSWSRRRLGQITAGIEEPRS